MKSKSVEKSDVKTLGVKTEKWPTGYRSQAIALCQRSFIQTKGEIWDKLSFIQVNHHKGAIFTSLF